MPIPRVHADDIRKRMKETDKDEQAVREMVHIMLAVSRDYDPCDSLVVHWETLGIVHRFSMSNNKGTNISQTVNQARAIQWIEDIVKSEALSCGYESKIGPFGQSFIWTMK